MGLTFTNVGIFEVIECDCGVSYALTEEFIANRRDSHKTFYCPNGCRRHYPGKNNEEKLQEILDQETEKLKRERIEREHAQGLFEAERNSHRSTRGHVTRIKNRISAGVCPCCNRSFQNLKNHMEGQHPDFKKK